MREKQRKAGKTEGLAEKIGMLASEKIQKVLVDTIEEDGRKGGFLRIFPTRETHRYERYFSY